MAAKPFAFVLMPFTKEFDDVYKLGIQAVARECGIVAERVDEQSFSETILERIYRQISAADFVIADMTGRNPNVFYEVGYAHALEKLCILLTRTADDIPFDLKHHRHIIYDGSIQTVISKLKHEIEWIKIELLKRKTTSISIEIVSVSGLLTKNSYAAFADVDFVFDAHNRSTKKSPDIEAMYLHTGSGWTFRQGSIECPSAPSGENFPKMTRHFITTPVTRMSPGTWAQIKLSGSKKVWNKFKGDAELRETYGIKGRAIFEVITSGGSYSETFYVETTVEDLPF